MEKRGDESEESVSEAESSYSESCYVSDDDSTSHSRNKHRRKREKSGSRDSRKRIKKSVRRTINSPHGILVPKNKTKKVRRINKRGCLDVATGDEHILIVDGACDQSIVHTSVCLILNTTSEYFHVGGAIQGMETETALQVGNAAVLVTNPYTKEKWVAVINQCLLLDNAEHREALLQPHQARCFGTAIDDCAKHHIGVDGKPGKQCIVTPEATIPLLHDGWKAYVSISKPSVSDMEKYPVVELTSPLPYNPAKRINSRRVSSN